MVMGTRGRSRAFSSSMTSQRDHRGSALSGRSWSAVSLCGFVVAGVAMLGTSIWLPSDTLRVLGISVLLYSIFGFVHHYVQRTRLRRAADAWIARGYEGRATWYAWRIAELTAS